MNRDALIVRQTAGKIVAQLLQGQGYQVIENGTFYAALEAVDAALSDVDSDTKSDANSAPSLSVVDGGATQPAPQLATPPASSNKKQNLWDYLYTNPAAAFNNLGDQRAKSGGGKGPDFKFKNSGNPFSGEGLWADSIPTSFNTAEGVVQFATQMEALDSLKQRLAA
tara:strand:- start:88 stop:588 length:501 start_codon:yes stop_codon:yes gene_type:complete